jgi:hypothetical protein
MESTTTNMTPGNRVRFPRPEAADRSLTFVIRGSFFALTQKAPGFKDVAYLGPWRTPV